MQSAFGIDHGVAKSFKSMAPKLARARESFGPHVFHNPGEKITEKVGRFRRKTTKAPAVSMKDRTRANYTVYRNWAGQMGRDENLANKPELLAGARRNKEMSRAFVTAAGNQTKRAGRKLP